jgi:hypothetical protein
MKVQLLSDLHLEANPGATFSPAPDAELLVLAGDIGSYQDRTQGPPLAEPDWGLQRFSPLPQYAGWPVPVLFVPGNHEYDGSDWDQTHRELRATCDRLGLIWLEREVCATARCSTPPPCANWRWSAKTGCAARWPSPLLAPRWR